MAPPQNVEFENMVKFGILCPSGATRCTDKLKFGKEKHTVPTTKYYSKIGQI